MNRSRFGDLEVLCHTPSGPVRETPLLFVHGAYTAAFLLLTTGVCAVLTVKRPQPTA